MPCMQSPWRTGFAQVLVRLLGQISNILLSKLVANCFDDFFKNLVSQYRGYKNLSFNCVGSVAYHFQHILEQSCQKFDMNLGNIRQSPMDGLELFHKARLT